MSLIIDGHNLIGVLPDIALGEPGDEQRLLDRLRAYRAATGGRPLIVFFDAGAFSGSPRNLSTPGIQVRFAHAGQTADDAIVAFLQSSREPGQYAVVTNDQALAQRCRALGANVQRASDFAGRLIRRPSRPADAAVVTPDPHDPAFADLYTGFAEAARLAVRFAAAPQADPAHWIELLYSGDVEEMQQAARWLGQHGGAQALAPLRDALTHNDVRVRAAALLALGDLGDRDAVADLCRHLTEDPAAMAREAAAQSLARIGDRASEAVLARAAREDAKGKVRKAAQKALNQLQARRLG